MNFKTTIYNNERAYVQVNNGNPFKSRKKFNRKNIQRNNEGWMPIADVKKTNKRWLKKLISLNIDSSKCKFVTLTLSQDMIWEDLVKKFKIFITSIRRRFDGNIEYIRAIQIQKESLRYHIHIILIFKDKVPQFKRKEIKKYWQYGNIDIENKVFNVTSIEEYLTLNKSLVGRNEDKNLSYFPKGARLISSTVKTPAERREISATEEEIQNMIDYCIKNWIHVRFDKHFYYENGERKERLDGILLMPGQDYIINNFGTKEDDEIFEKLKRRNYENKK